MACSTKSSAKPIFDTYPVRSKPAGLGIGRGTSLSNAQDVSSHAFMERRRVGNDLAVTNRGISAAELQKKVFPPIRWAVPEVIPDGLTLLAGKPKRGKSWLVLQVANAIATGGSALDAKPGMDGDVLYAALEDNRRRLQDRMAKVCSSKIWPGRLTFWCEMSMIGNGGIEQLRQWINSVERPALIVIDTYVKVRTAQARSENVYDADHRAAKPLKDLADATGIPIILVHHLRKQAAEDDPFDAVSGSTGLTGAVDTILVLNRYGEGDTLYGRGRDIPEFEVAMSFDKLSCRWSVLGNPAEVHRSTERRGILSALQSSPTPMSAADVSDATGKSPSSVRKLLSAMARDGEVKRTERGKYAHP